MTTELFTKEIITLRVIESIEGLEEGSPEVIIKFTDGTYIKQYHEQDCCETVLVEQVDGDVSKHIGATMIDIHEKVLRPNDDTDEYGDILYEGQSYESLTATFYTMKTSKGYLDWRWYGESNGYYSESVECEFIDKGNI